MSRSTSSLAALYEGWEAYQTMLVDTIRPLGDDQLALRPASHLRPAWLIAAHIIAVRVFWFQESMNEGNERTRQFGRWHEEHAPPRSAAELVTGLDVTWEMMRECLERWTLDDRDVRFADQSNPRYSDSRGWIVWHVMEHDIHHGGELFLTFGIHGLPTPDM